MPSADIVYNPVAGRVSAEEAVRKAALALQAAGWEARALRSRSRRHTTQLARLAAQEGRDALFVAGGDGTLGEAARGLLGSRTALGVLPGGTANVWAQELGFAALTAFRPNAMEEAARSQAEGWTQWMDVGLCNERPFLLWTGLGLDGEVVRQMERERAGRRRFPFVRYAWHILRSIVRWRGLRLSMEVDGQAVEDHYILALVSNIRLYNGGFTTLAERNCVDDGQLDLWLFRGEHPADSFRYVLELLSNRHHDDPAVSRHAFEHITVRSRTRFVLQMDGEAVRGPKRLEIAARPRALRVLVPSQPPEGLFSRPAERIQ